MKRKYFRILLFGIVIGLIIIITLPFHGCKKPEPEEKDTCQAVYKPNIYIYPKSNINIKVIISFPKGGKIIKSIPDYNKFWDVNVDNTGKIDNKYDYLFYESKQPKEWQYKTGWIIEKEYLMSFFQKNMKEYGFNSKEIKDFTDFWIPLLKTFKYYLIYPQEKIIIDKLIQIDYSIKPDNLLRLFYVIKGTNKIVPIGKHNVNSSFKREDFCVTEWGVII